MGETYYDVLEVDEDATEAEIREAYRDRVLETHPDQNDAADATVAFERVKRAQEVLTDGDERARYDRLGHEAYLESEAGVTGASRTVADAASSDRGGGRRVRDRRRDFDPWWRWRPLEGGGRREDGCDRRVVAGRGRTVGTEPPRPTAPASSPLASGVSSGRSLSSP